MKYFLAGLFIAFSMFLADGSALAESSPEQGSDPLVEILIKKGVIRMEDLGVGPPTRDALIEALRKKGILTDEEAQALQSQAPVTRQEVQDIREEVKAMTKEAPVSIAPSLPKWLEKLEFKGDVRLRYEGFDFDGKDLGQEDKKQRNRLRYRLRFGLEKKWEEGITAGFRLASGNPDDPISNNITFGDGLDPDTINIDRAYLAYKPEFAEWFWITGGRFENPFVHTEMMFDPDLNLEGLVEKAQYSPLEGLSLFALTGQVVLDESAAGVDSLLWVWQGGMGWKLVDSVNTILSVGYYNYQNPDNSNELADESTRAGNSGTRRAGNNPATLAFQYRVVNVVNKWTVEVLERPLLLWWDLAFNLADDRGGAALTEDTAWSLGARYGRLKERNDWDVSLAYRYIEADSLFAAFTDSEVNGTNREGFAGSIGWQALMRLELRASVFASENIEEAGFNTSDQDYFRWQLDAIVKF